MGSKYPPDSGYLGSTPKNATFDVMIIDDKPTRIYKVVIHTFTVGDVEDPQIYAAGPLLECQNSEAGTWVMENAIETPMWHQTKDYNIWGNRFAITAKLKDEDYTYYLLRFT